MQVQRTDINILSSFIDMLGSFKRAIWLDFSVGLSGPMARIVYPRTSGQDKMSAYGHSAGTGAAFKKHRLVLLAAGLCSDVSLFFFLEFVCDHPL